MRAMPLHPMLKAPLTFLFAFCLLLPPFHDQVMLAPDVIGRSGSDAYGWAPGKYYAVAPYAEEGLVSRCGKVRIWTTSGFELCSGCVPVQWVGCSVIIAS